MAEFDIVGNVFAVVLNAWLFSSSSLFFFYSFFYFIRLDNFSCILDCRTSEYRSLKSRKQQEKWPKIIVCFCLFGDRLCAPSHIICVSLVRTISTTVFLNFCTILFSWLLRYDNAIRCWHFDIMWLWWPQCFGCSKCDLQSDTRTNYCTLFMRNVIDYLCKYRSIISLSLFISALQTHKLLRTSLHLRPHALSEFIQLYLLIPDSARSRNYIAAPHFTQHLKSFNKHFLNYLRNCLGLILIQLTDYCWVLPFIVWHRRIVHLPSLW